MTPPPTYDALVRQILAAQDPKSPAFKSEREVREYLAENYPGLEGNYAAVMRLANAHMAAEPMAFSPLVRKEDRNEKA